MTEKLKQTIEEEVSQLPKEMREAIGASAWIKTAEEIGLKYELSEDEIEDFQLETLLALIGATDLEFYAINIENHVELTKDKAESIAKEAYEKIFAPIKKTLEESVKKNMKNRTPDWKQTVDFVLSGGDYSAFMESPSSDTPKTDELKNKLVI